MNVKIKLGEGAKLPHIGKIGDSGMDLYATSMRIEQTSGYGYIEYGTCLFLEIPIGFEGWIVPRSSISNKGLILANSLALIDSNYRNEILLRFKYIAGTDYYQIGDKIGQLLIKESIPIEWEIVEELSLSEREGGFGTSGN